MAVEFILANEDAAKIIAGLRHRIWNTTYRGIYSDDSIGYFTFLTTETVYIQSLYIQQKYQRQGIGKQAFALIREYCRTHGFDKFTCNCNSHNYSAQNFYRSMGGTIIRRNEGHDDKYDDQITFEFCV